MSIANLKIPTRYSIPPGKIALREVCTLLHISMSTAKRRIKAGELVPVESPGRHKPVLFDLETIRAMAGPGAPRVEYVPVDEKNNGSGLITVSEALRRAGRKENENHGL